MKNTEITKDKNTNGSRLLIYMMAGAATSIGCMNIGEGGLRGIIGIAVPLAAGAVCLISAVIKSRRVIKSNRT